MPIARVEAALRRVGLDRYMMLLVGTVLLASLCPARGEFARILGHVTYWAVALLFFLYGAKLATATILSGLTNWKLQLGCLACTYVMFPLLAIAMQPVVGHWLPAAFVAGLLYLACLPSTVQSSIAFTSVSGGNVAGAVCAASISNVLGVLLAPVLFMLLIPAEVGAQGGVHVDASAIWKIARQILLPFALGQLCRPLLSGFLNRHKLPTIIVDRGSILLIVYAAFSAGVVNGIWSAVAPGQLAALMAAIAVLLALVMGLSLVMARLGGMMRADTIALYYCGSTKSLATGLPMAGILFAGQNVAMIVLPLMLFHLLQLFVCAIVSQRLALRVAV
ncbi:bile acid:sodium symporter [Paracoccus sp. DMF-8]|uniref:bile acid:sodium symporter family protein n=1 Tax=Paracoccus sp. DMF-8 TaxID=3019445 RepID=UPI0023E3888D|nr:bile acid:sodium symporter family protein [Paracoccus sp. DMF-8]MDF3607465.1 bile acid:sodium symporter [Paracoccus sp. DMF-8]